MHPEIRHQLYGGEISDYYKKPEPKDVKQENKELADIYDAISKKRLFVKEGADLPPPPPAIIQQVDNTKLTFDDVIAFVKKHEGYRTHVYKDSLGIPTIGIGFNLTRPDARKIIQSVGAEYDAVLAGIDGLSDEQIKKIFNITIKIAYEDAKRWIPNYDSLPKNIKLAVLDLSFNMGYNRLSGFFKTKEYILKKDYKAAANELMDSKWAKQVGNRAKSIFNLFSSSV